MVSFIYQKTKYWKYLLGANTVEIFLASGVSGWKITLKKSSKKKIHKGRNSHILLKMDENLEMII